MTRSSGLSLATPNHPGRHDNLNVDVAAEFGTSAAAIVSAVAVAAANPGTRLYFGPYTWTIGTTDLTHTSIGLGTFFHDSGYLVRLPSHTTLYGPGTIQMNGVPAEGLNPPYTNHYTVFGMGGGETHVRFEGLTFTGENDPFVWYSGNQSAPIRVYSSSEVSDVEIVGCTFKNLYGFSVQSEGTVSRVNIRDCTVKEVGNTFNNNSDYGRVEHCTFTTSGGTECSGIGVKIVGNTFKTCKTSAISLGGRTAVDAVGVIRGAVVSNNDIDGCDGSGIVVADGVRGAVISNNNLTRCDLGAIIMTYSTGYPPTDCLIVGNTLFGNSKRSAGVGYAMIISGGGRHFVLANNIIDDPDSSTYWQHTGIETFGTGHTIIGNRITTSDRFGTSRGIQLENGATAHIGPNDITGTVNLVSYAGTGAPLQANLTSSASTDVWIESLYAGGHAWKMRASGKLEWAELYGSYDTSLERSAANVLATGSDDAIKTGAAAHGSLPSPASYAAGAQFYCSSDKKPVWSDGSAHWVDAAGANHT